MKHRSPSQRELAEVDDKPRLEKRTAQCWPLLASLSALSTVTSVTVLT